MEVADPTTDEKNGQAKIASSASQNAVVINSKKKERQDLQIQGFKPADRYKFDNKIIMD
jgi:hypothetical protein